MTITSDDETVHLDFFVKIAWEVDLLLCLTSNESFEEGVNSCVDIDSSSRFNLEHSYDIH